jgi:predicted O-linked N-acetylglucosamine transferase (SPINDLY family)
VVPGGTQQVSAERTVAKSGRKPITASQKKEIDALIAKAFAMKPGPAAMKVWNSVLELNPRDGNALVQMGINLISNEATAEEGASYLERAFESTAEPPIPVNSFQGYSLAWLLGCRDKALFSKQKRFLTLAAESTFATDDCHAIQLATLVPQFPTSVEHARQMIVESHKSMDELLTKKTLRIDKIQHVDPYSICLHNPFFFSLYYERPPRLAAEKHFQLAIKAQPTLLYVAPHLLMPTGHLLREHERRTKVGFVTAFISVMHPSVDAFFGLLERLSRDVFDVYIVHVREARFNQHQPHATQYLKNLGQNSHIITVGMHNDWLDLARNEIGKLDLDLLVYLDHSISDRSQRLAYCKLARVQATSFGHTVTSGIPREIQNYFISWETMELSLPQAQDFYTEELVLLPANAMHGYLKPHSNGGVSIVDNLAFDTLTRFNFTRAEPSELDDTPRVPLSGPNLPVSSVDGHWYTCLVSALRRHPVFDEMLVNIQKRDPLAHLILMVEPNENQPVLQKRLQDSGADLLRVHFVDSLMPHYYQMGLYALSDVVLDAYYAGDPTAARDAFEVGGRVVTLPANLMGSRITMAYYKVMGVQGMVARDRSEYAAAPCPSPQ